MFGILQAVRSLICRSMYARAAKAAEKLKAPAETLEAKLKLASRSTSKDPGDLMALFSLKQQTDKAVEAFLVADAVAEKWKARRDRAVTPTSRIPAYLSGKLDAAVAGVLLYPYVPDVISWCKGLVG